MQTVRIEPIEYSCYCFSCYNPVSLDIFVFILLSPYVWRIQIPHNTSHFHLLKLHNLMLLKYNTASYLRKTCGTSRPFDMPASGAGSSLPAPCPVQDLFLCEFVARFLSPFKSVPFHPLRLFYM